MSGRCGFDSQREDSLLGVPKWLRGLTVTQLYVGSNPIAQPKRCEHDSNDSNQTGKEIGRFHGHGSCYLQSSALSYLFSLGAGRLATRRFFGVWPSLVRRLLWEQKIGGSNPSTPTLAGVGKPTLDEGIPSLVAKVVLPFQCDAEKLEEWVCSSTGRALVLQAGGSVFESRQIHKR